MKIVDTYLEQLMQEVFWKNTKDYTSCAVGCVKLLKLAKKTALGILAGGPIGSYYVNFLSKSGKLGDLCYTRCSQRAFRKTLATVKDPEKKERYKRVLAKGEERIKKKDDIVKELMKRLKKEGKKEGLEFVRKHYDIINRIR